MQAPPPRRAQGVRFPLPIRHSIRQYWRQWQRTRSRRRTRLRGESDQVANELLGELKPEDAEQTFRDELARLKLAGIQLRGDEIRAMRDQILAEVATRNAAKQDEATREQRENEAIEKSRAEVREEAFREYLALIKAAKLGDASAQRLLPEFEAAYQNGAGNLGRSGSIFQQFQTEQDQAKRRADIERELEQARNQLRSLQMRGLEQATSPWRDLQSINWFAQANQAGSQADRLDQFRATNSLSMPDSVQAQMRELQQREVA